MSVCNRGSRASLGFKVQTIVRNAGPYYRLICCQSTFQDGSLSQKSFSADDTLQLQRLRTIEKSYLFLFSCSSSLVGPSKDWKSVTSFFSMRYMVWTSLLFASLASAITNSLLSWLPLRSSFEICYVTGVQANHVRIHWQWR